MPGDDLADHCTEFRLPGCFSNVQPIGYASAGIVCQARDSRVGRDVAIKKVSRIFGSLIFAARTVRELRILRHVSHPNILSISAVFVDRPRESYRNIYVISQLMESDLTTVLQSSSLSSEHVQFILFQMLRAVGYLHRCGIVHRDLKPRNILLNASCTVKVTGFGLACPVSPESEGSPASTGYVQTRWYRAPEVLCAFKFHGKPVDLWSIGCTLGEMFVGRPVFAGPDTQRQLEEIAKCLGPPSSAFIQRSTAHKCREFLSSKAGAQGHGIKAAVPQATQDAMVVLDALLQWTPEARPTVDEVLNMTFMHPLSEDLVLVPGTTLPGSLFEMEFTEEHLRDAIFEEARFFSAREGCICGGRDPSHTGCR
mmetsp:Transcript_86155/g.230738  ORF Transcript_86155/g.230738 Transcript_86155/m.230738 type:complete len:368 (-) Transcript_86155:32-1135(-)